MKMRHGREDAVGKMFATNEIKGLHEEPQRKKLKRTRNYAGTRPAELGGREFEFSLRPRGRASGAEARDLFDGIDRSSCERAKKSSSSSYGDEDALIWQLEQMCETIVMRICQQNGGIVFKTQLTHCPSTSATRDASSWLNFSSVPSCACNRNSSLSERLPGIGVLADFSTVSVADLVRPGVALESLVAGENDRISRGCGGISRVGEGLRDSV